MPPLRRPDNLILGKEGLRGSLRCAPVIFLILDYFIILFGLPVAGLFTLLRFASKKIPPPTKNSAFGPTKTIIDDEKDDQPPQLEPRGWRSVEWHFLSPFPYIL
jgi:hypothetical protein